MKILVNIATTILIVAGVGFAFGFIPFELLMGVVIMCIAFALNVIIWRKEIWRQQ